MCLHGMRTYEGRSRKIQKTSGQQCLRCSMRPVEVESPLSCLSTFRSSTAEFDEGQPGRDDTRAGIECGGGDGGVDVTDGSASPPVPQHSQSQQSPITSTESENEKRRFLCPYRKRYGDAGCTAPSCYGIGWPDIHRVKEHLIRKHGPLPACLRCASVFKDQVDLAEHMRRKDVCIINAESSARGNTNFDKEQLEALKKRRKLGSSEEDEWARYYKILFKDQTVVPTPYLNNHNAEFALTPAFQQDLKNALVRELRERFTTMVPQNINYAHPNFSIGALIQTAVGVGLIEKAVECVVNPRKRRASSSSAQPVVEQPPASEPESALTVDASFTTSQSQTSATPASSSYVLLETPFTDTSQETLSSPHDFQFDSSFNEQILDSITVTAPGKTQHAVGESALDDWFLQEEDLSQYISMNDAFSDADFIIGD